MSSVVFWCADLPVEMPEERACKFTRREGDIPYFLALSTLLKQGSGDLQQVWATLEAFDAVDDEVQAWLLLLPEDYDMRLSPSILAWLWRRTSSFTLPSWIREEEMSLAQEYVKSNHLLFVYLARTAMRRDETTISLFSRALDSYDGYTRCVAKNRTVELVPCQAHESDEAYPTKLDNLYRELDQLSKGAIKVRSTPSTLKQDMDFVAHGGDKRSSLLNVVCLKLLEECHYEIYQLGMTYTLSYIESVLPIVLERASLHFEESIADFLRQYVLTQRNLVMSILLTKGNRTPTCSCCVV